MRRSIGIFLSAALFVSLIAAFFMIFSHEFHLGSSWYKTSPTPHLLPGVGVKVTPVGMIVAIIVSGLTCIWCIFELDRNSPPIKKEYHRGRRTK